MKITKRQLKRIIREEQARVTKKYDDDSALTGDQDELPDELQKGIIDKTVEEREKEKNESVRITKRQLKRIIKEAMPSGGVPDVVGAVTGVYGEEERQRKDKPGADSAAAVEKAKTVIEQQLNNLYHEHFLENADLVAILEQTIKDIKSGFVGEPT